MKARDLQNIPDVQSSPDSRKLAIDQVGVKAIRHPFLLSMERVEEVNGDLVIVLELADKNLQDLLTDYRRSGAPGVPREERGRVFQEFYRRDVDGHRGGTGLGLAIAQAIVIAHGGMMSMEETPGGGATIRFRLPLVAKDGKDRAVAASPIAGKPPR